MPGVVGIVFWGRRCDCCCYYHYD